MRRAICLLSLASFLLLVPSADAMIQLDRGIAGVRIDNTKAQVRAALGKPRSKIDRPGKFGPTTTFRYNGGIRVIFVNGRVTLVTTTGLGDRTRRGVGVGSREQAVEDKVPGVECDTITGIRFCQRGEQAAGERITVFFIEDGRVNRVDVGVVLD